MIRCIAIDDEPKALEIIKSHISKIDSVILKQSFTDPFKAISYLNENTIDLVFLDINMPNLSGLDLLNAIDNKPHVIFTTAHSEYAMQSYEVKAVDYLLKPFDFPRFALAISKVQEKLKATTAGDQDFVFVNTGTQKQRLVFDDLYYVQADGNYVSYFTRHGKLMVRSSIKEALNLLPTAKFVQVHRSYLVNIRQIDKIEDNRVYIADQKIAISASYRTSFMKKVDSYNS
ncbi:MAG: LytTR family DNA-binding domain-containing protein [Reichenbachiella sp.]|uniref:LytR/AlgR family response regulator transcription factor n=1 Tax=Reichenbachiella sp. TaxID=2184521 RepID=UPI003267ADD5